MEDREESVQHFLDLIKRSRRGKFKIYIGLIAGVGKSYRMLQEAHEMLENGVDVQIGYIETHGLSGSVAVSICKFTTESTTNSTIIATNIPMARVSFDFIFITFIFYASIIKSMSISAKECRNFRYLERLNNAPGILKAGCPIQTVVIPR